MSKLQRLSHWSRLLLVASLIGGGTFVAARWAAQYRKTTVDVVMPLELSARALDGRTLFEASCAECHGPTGGGNESGPPLIHLIYAAGHHADLAFVLAVQRGVRAHHWPFGDMPPQPQLTPAQIGAITRFVREVQVANGIGGE